MPAKLFSESIKLLWQPAHNKIKGFLSVRPSFKSIVHIRRANKMVSKLAKLVLKHLAG